MSFSSKIFDAFIGIIKINDQIAHLTEDSKNLMKEVKEIDRRLIRIETLVEIVEKQRNLIPVDL